MEKYIKAALYAYPLLQAMEEDYRESIETKALLSYKSQAPAWETAEYLAGEIIQKRRVEWLKERIDRVLERLNDAEKTLLSIRYFGKEKKIKRLLSTSPVCGEYVAWSESKYFRVQKRLAEKVGGMLVCEGVTQEAFEKDFAPFPPFNRIYRFVQEGKDQIVTQSERQWLRLSARKPKRTAMRHSSS